MVKIHKQKPKPLKRKLHVGRGIMDRATPIDFDEKEGISLNVYGKSGTGKTTLWATFPDPIFCMVCSGKGELRSIDTLENKRRIKHATILHSSELLEVVSHQAKTEEYATIVLDHATGLQDRVLAEILELEELPAQKAWGMASQQEYGQCALQMKELLRKLLGLTCNIVIVAQEREFNTENNTSEFLNPYVASALTPSVVGWLNPACDYLCETYKRRKVITKDITIGKKTKTKTVETKEVEYCLRTGPDPVFTTKFRVPKGRELPYVIIDPTYDKIMRIIKGGKLASAK